MSIKVDRENEHLIAVLGPRHKGNYARIMPAVIRAVDLIEHEAGDGAKEAFIFIHDGITSGSAGEMIEAVNKVQNGARARGRIMTHRKKLLELELHGGRKAHRHWVDEIVDLEPDLFLLFDSGEFPPVSYAKDQATEAGIQTLVIPVSPEREK